MEKMHSANVRSLQKIHDYQKEQLAEFKAEIEGSKNSMKGLIGNFIIIQKTNTYITWALVVVAIIITFVLKK